MDVLIVDDEIDILAEIEFYLQKYGGFDSVIACSNPLEALEQAGKIAFDVALLDIEVPGMNGLELSDKLSSLYPQIGVVFLTAHNHFATEAFEANAIDYILKPIREDRFFRALDKLKTKGGNGVKVILVDDEKAMLLVMKKMLSKIPGIELVGSFQDGQDACRFVQQQSVDLVIADIRMPGDDGFALAREILAINPDLDLIFLTAYKEYALDAFDIYAFDYIVKPVSRERLERTISKVIAKRKLSKPSRTGGQVKITCLGGFAVYGLASGEKVHWLTAKIEELCAYLITYGDRPVDKWTLCDLLWPNMDPEKAKHNLYSSVYRLKKISSQEGVPIKIISNINEYRIQKDDNCQIDSKVFKRIVMVTTLITEENLATAVQAEKMFQGELFAGKGYLWSAGLSEELNRMYTQLVHKLASYYLENAKYREAVDSLQKLLKFNPVEETANRLLMLTYAQMKDKAALAAHYAWYDSNLLKELSIEPSMEIKHLFHQLIKKL